MNSHAVGSNYEFQVVKCLWRESTTKDTKAAQKIPEDFPTIKLNFMEKIKKVGHHPQDPQPHHNFLVGGVSIIAPTTGAVKTRCNT